MYYLAKLFILMLILFSLQACQPQQKSQPSQPSQPKSHPVAMISDTASINLVVGRLFLARNKLRPDIHTLQSGLQYKIIKQGAGRHPKLQDKVTVYYQGEFIDGRVFDDNHAKKNPLTLQVSATIPAWQEVLPLMRPGAVWVLYVPAYLAYGQKGIPGLVGPNETLVFSLHLQGVGKSNQSIQQFPVKKA
jgi:FKBP-type peptidyl-prolyl cis-trans isomerase FklB